MTYGVSETEYGICNARREEQRVFGHGEDFWSVALLALKANESELQGSNQPYLYFRC
jgi:hypothetical protein